jgi:competence protein ComEA
MGVHGLAPSHRRLLGVAALVLAGLLLLVHHLHGGGAHHVVVPLRTAAPARRAAALLVVDVAGAVRRPGLYRLPQGSRVADAVARAGGPGANAEVALVNLAAPLADGEQVVVPRRGEADAAAGSPNAPLDLNTASAEQLDALPGIGPATAAKIVQYRQAHGPFRSAEDLDAVPGIGPSRIAQLKGLVLP